MSLFAWVGLGLVSGFVASKVINHTHVVLDVGLGIAGAVLAGWLFITFGTAGVGGLNLYSFPVAMVGAITVLVAYHVLAHTVRGQHAEK